MPLSANLRAAISASQTVAMDLGTVGQPISLVADYVFTDGVAINQANVIFSDHRSISSSATWAPDLHGGAGTTTLFQATGASDPAVAPTAAIMTRLKAIMVKAAAANTVNLTLSSPASNGVAGLFTALGDGIVIRPGGCVLWVAPDATAVAITGATGDLLNIVNGAAGSEFDIVIVGTV